MIKRTPTDRHLITQDIYDTIILPLFYHADVDGAKHLMKLCYEAGLRVIEFTNRAAYAFEVFAPLNKYVKQELPGMRLGIGTVTDVGMTAMYLQAGVDFVVMPSLQADVIALCNKRKVLCIPGCGSVTEISKAEELGCEIVKLFPGNHFGPGFVKDLLGPMPWSSILVSGGVEPNKENIQSWVKAGAKSLALGSKLFTPSVLAGEDDAGLSAAIKNCLIWAREAKNG
ncbi:MAG: bifunctional 4-hydroxy-2-oxoglutarate aldolase/2-dehydro-3-deoxy-phosphogluconate aldolase [Saprospiraceae bacterium]|nr:bifunctional 4-hydroxy-2-oxoglutarate aldolase/2-dehydro-3-deoxy-phosphogluconate aldolase [Saprospiraceae bacterium]